MAAKTKCGTEVEQPLPTSPIYLEVEYGESFEGHWMYNAMVLQLEDCADVVKILYIHNTTFYFCLTTDVTMISFQMMP
jgi:hypothetical protein